MLSLKFISLKIFCDIEMCGFAPFDAKGGRRRMRRGDLTSKKDTTMKRCEHFSQEILDKKLKVTLEIL